jgi:hypothetical protein
MNAPWEGATFADKPRRIVPTNSPVTEPVPTDVFAQPVGFARSDRARAITGPAALGSHGVWENADPPGIPIHAWRHREAGAHGSQRGGIFQNGVQHFPTPPVVDVPIARTTDVVLAGFGADGLGAKVSNARERQILVHGRSGWVATRSTVAEVVMLIFNPPANVAPYNVKRCDYSFYYVTPFTSKAVTFPPASGGMTALEVANKVKTLMNVLPLGSQIAIVGDVDRPCNEPASLVQGSIPRFRNIRKPRPSMFRRFNGFGAGPDGLGGCGCGDW